LQNGSYGELGSSLPNELTRVTETSFPSACRTGVELFLDPEQVAQK